MSRDAIQGFLDLGINLLQGYGLTETSPVISVESDHAIKIGSVGKPLPSIELKIEDKDEKGIGEIVVKGSSIMLGYYQNNTATEEVFTGEWFHTGDLGYLENGYLYITGRKSRFIKIYGKRVSLDEIQMSIENHMLVKKCVCIQKNDQLYIFISQNGSEKGKIVSFLWEKYRIWKERLSFIFVEEFPYNEYGKIQYSKLERILEL